MSSQPSTSSREILRRFHELAQTRPRRPFREWFDELRGALAELTGVLRQHHELLDTYRAREDQKALRETEDDRRPTVELARSKQASSPAPECHLVTDLLGNIREASYAAAVLFRIPREFLVHKPLPFLVAETDRGGFCTRLARLNLQAELIQNWEMRLQPRHAEPINVRATVTVLADEDGRPHELRWLLRDVTEQTQMRQALSAEKELADNVLEAAPALMLVVDGEGRIVRANAFAESATGRWREHLLGQPWWTVLERPTDQAEARQHLARALLGQNPETVLYPLSGGNGRPRLIAWSAKKLPELSGQPARALVVGHDITEIQQAHEQATQLERLAAIGQMTAGLAHEGRNTLARSIGLLHVLAFKVEKQPEAVDLIHRALTAHNDLTRLFEDVCLYAGHLQLDCQPCNVQEVILELWCEMLPIRPERKAHLTTEADGIEPTAVADRFRLRQVFQNLFDNSLGACQDPVRLLVAFREGRLHEQRALEITVRDNGPGLSDEQRRRMFQPFYTTKARGTGLGLAIARRIIEAHGGTLAAGNGNAAAGAELVITLPRSRPGQDGS